MMKMWDIATSNQGGRGLASFVGTMNYDVNRNKDIYSCFQADKYTCKHRQFNFISERHFRVLGWKGHWEDLEHFIFFKGKVKGVCGNKITSNYLNRRRRYMAEIRRKTLYLHFIRNARLKSIRSSEWYLPITARPNHLWYRTIYIRTIFSVAT